MEVITRPGKPLFFLDVAVRNPIQQELIVAANGAI